jgi:hypothetical protein
MFALPAADAVFDLAQVTLRLVLQAAINFQRLLGQVGHLPLEHGALFASATSEGKRHCAHSP